jgi:hydroxymethylpyrimidine kinase/phosphomethylpyrimidine kinase/thiamine-phosphate diphosphorylase
MSIVAPTPESIKGIPARSSPVVWTVAGSDSGGGAGIQADLKTMNALGVHACSVITALTAQNTLGVRRIEYPSLEMLTEQLEALRADLSPVAVKIGMLGEPAGIRCIVDTIKTCQAFIVCDPVLVATSGDPLLHADALHILKHELLPHVDLLTPNWTETESLLGIPILTSDCVEAAADAFLALGVRSVLIKGGHGNSKFSQDFYSDGQTRCWLTSPRQETKHHHGTGCTLSAAITACIGLGHDLLDAVVIGKAYVNQGLRNAPGLGQGCGPLAHSGWPEHEPDLPWLTPNAEAGTARYSFPDCGSMPLGFYPIINRADWLLKLLPLGVTTVQLRIKDLEGEALADEIARAIVIARDYDARLFINDYWELALRYGAYGVHLGQGDLETANLVLLAQKNIRLGISTHCYSEVARALAIRPSYIAIGPVFHTTTKSMTFAPQGLDALRQWRKLLPFPLVAIGGIFLENAPEVVACGVDAVSVVRDLTQTDNLEQRVHDWLALLGGTIYGMGNITVHNYKAAESFQVNGAMGNGYVYFDNLHIAPPSPL